MAYWIGATDQRFEGDFKWTDNMPFAFASKRSSKSHLIQLSKFFIFIMKYVDSFLSLLFSFKEWFPGWKQYENYNRQPNDDGLSEQDCVEVRRYFHRPSTNSAAASDFTSNSFLVDSFMWNDRDCLTRNFFLCESPMVNGE